MPKRVTNKVEGKKEERRRMRQELQNKKQELRKIRSEVSAPKDDVEKVERKRKKKRVQQEIFQLGKELYTAREQRAKNRGRTSEHRKRIRSKRRDLVRIKEELRAAKYKAERFEHRRRKEDLKREILQLEGELRAEREWLAEEKPQIGALPDFVVIGAMKGGTTYLYHLVTQHPYVEPCAKKELHFFDLLFEKESVEWYQRSFPRPRLKGERRTITGEASPGYLCHFRAPERMAKVVPRARLIALLRNPVDRAYSHYQQRARKGRETRTFEEALNYSSLDDDSWYLSRSVYVDQLLRWSKFISKGQMLVLKSEDFFEHPQETLNRVFDFLDLPDWEPQASKISSKGRNKGDYEEGMDPATRRRLEEYFEPHNKRLYDHLGVDFGW